MALSKAEKSNQTKTRRAKRVAEGLCVRCAAPTSLGRRHCDHHREEIQQRSLEQRVLWRDAGLCTRCGQPSVSGRVLCQRHLDKEVDQHRLRVERRVCTCCSKAAAPGRQKCEEHLLAAKTHRDNIRALGRCARCQEPAAHGRTKCLRHLAESSAYTKAKLLRHASKRLCSWCKEPAAPGKKLCLKHVGVDNARQTTDEHRALARDRRNLAKAEGRCTVCKRRPRGDHTLTCSSCWFVEVASRLRGVGTLELRSLWHSQQGRCALTGQLLVQGKNASVDHIVPRSRGGKDEIANLRWVVLHANFAKGAMLDEDFVAMCKRVAEKHAKAPP